MLREWKDTKDEWKPEWIAALKKLEQESPRRTETKIYKKTSPPPGFASISYDDGKGGAEIGWVEMSTGKERPAEFWWSDVPPSAACFTSGIKYLEACSMNPPLVAPRYLRTLTNQLIVPAPQLRPPGALLLIWPGLVLSNQMIAQPVLNHGASSPFSTQSEFYIQGGDVHQPGSRVPSGAILRSRIDQTKRPDGKYQVVLSWQNVSPSLLHIMTSGHLTAAFMGVLEYQGTSSYCQSFSRPMTFSGTSLTLDNGTYPSGSLWTVFSQAVPRCGPTPSVYKANPNGGCTFKYLYPNGVC